MYNLYLKPIGGYLIIMKTVVSTSFLYVLTSRLIILIFKFHQTFFSVSLLVLPPALLESSSNMFVTSSSSNTLICCCCCWTVALAWSPRVGFVGEAGRLLTCKNYPIKTQDQVKGPNDPFSSGQGSKFCSIIFTSQISFLFLLLGAIYSISIHILQSRYFSNRFLHNF